MTYEQTMFSPPCGDCTYKGYIQLAIRRLSPPYGDCTEVSNMTYEQTMFSPPYGDCTARLDAALVIEGFSPPYGDCTLNISQNTAKLKSRMAGKYSLYCNDVLLR